MNKIKDLSDKKIREHYFNLEKRNKVMFYAGKFRAIFNK